MSYLRIHYMRSKICLPAYLNYNARHIDAYLCVCVWMSLCVCMAVYVAAALFRPYLFKGATNFFFFSFFPFCRGGGGGGDMLTGSFAGSQRFAITLNACSHINICVC